MKSEVKALKCARCGSTAEPDEIHEHHGQTLCDDCYMDALSPAKACDPWAVYTAKSCENLTGGDQVNPVQRRILDALAETGGQEPQRLRERLDLDPKELERQLASLRHMEKVRAEMRGDRKVLVLW
jgi:NMD protein affecting ribosome stability and mRNA decay